MLTAIAVENIEYDEIKRLIKAKTTGSDGNPIPLPPTGEDAVRVDQLRNEAYEKLVNEHQRLGFFWKAHATEVLLRLSM
jgi:hypothetical protein